MITMVVIVDMLMDVDRSLVAVFVAVMARGHFRLGVLRLMPVLLAPGLASVVTSPPANR
jgi:hypothetical protein